MKDARFVIGENIVPLKAPIDSGGTAYNSPWVSLANAHRATFFLYFGNITTTSADQVGPTVTMEAATAASSGSEVAIAFNYRLSGATGANSWGAITATTASGVAVDKANDDNKIFAIDINPHILEAALADATHVRLVMTPATGGAVTINAAWVEFDPRYPQLSHISAT